MNHERGFQATGLLVGIVASLVAGASYLGVFLYKGNTSNDKLLCKK